MLVTFQKFEVIASLDEPKNYERGEALILFLGPETSEALILVNAQGDLGTYSLQNWAYFSISEKLINYHYLQLKREALPVRSSDSSSVRNLCEDKNFTNLRKFRPPVDEIYDFPG